MPEIRIPGRGSDCPLQGQGPIPWPREDGASLQIVPPSPHAGGEGSSPRGCGVLIGYLLLGESFLQTITKTDCLTISVGQGSGSSLAGMAPEVTVKLSVNCGHPKAWPGLRTRCQGGSLAWVAARCWWRGGSLSSSPPASLHRAAQVS